jgi:lipopolysaccharide export system permease protein
MTLFRYLFVRYVFVFSALLGVLGIFSSLVTMVEITAEFSRSNLGFQQILGLTLLRVPGTLYQILPLVVILATVAMLLGLARSSELVVARSAGRSGLVLLMAPALAAFLIGLVAIGAANPIVAATKSRYDEVASRYKAGGRSILSISGDALWLRQGDAEGQVVIRAERSNNQGNEFKDVTFLGLDSDGTPSFRIQADAAELTPAGWAIRDATRWEIEPGIDPQTAMRKAPLMHLDSNLTVDQVRDGFGDPSTNSLWELPSFIKQLQQAGFSARRHQMWMQAELSQPLMLVAMVLVSAAFTMRPQRMGQTGMLVVGAIGLGFGAYFIRNLMSLLGENGQLPIIAAAWGPPVAIVLFAVGIILHMEDG